MFQQQISTEERNWQRSRPFIAQRNAALVANELWSDITFYIEQDDVYIPAHRIILAAGSSVFEKIAFGTFGDSETIHITDISLNGFQEIIRYLYTDKAILDKLNAIEIMYGAHKYDLPYLETMCANFLIHTLCEQNVCTLYECSYIFDNELAKKCVELIQDEIKEIIHTDGFYNLNVKTLKKILSIDQLNLEEIELFQAMLSWSENACKNDDVPATVENKRIFLKKAEHCIRFPTMRLDEFKKCIELEKTFFTTDEINDILKSITTGVVDKLPYSDSKRKHSQVYFCKTCNLLNGKVIILREFTNCYEYFQIRSNINVALFGFGVFSTDLEGPARINIVSENRFDSDLKLKKDVIHCDGSSKVYKIMFQEPLEIIAGRWNRFNYINLEGLNHSFFYHCDLNNGRLLINNGDGVIFELARGIYYDHSRIPELYYIKK